MKIKQLEWMDLEGHSFARTPFGLYDSCDDGWWEGMFTGHSRAYKSGRASGQDLDAAKAACQADFERRVRECVEVEPCLYGRVGKQLIGFASGCGSSACLTSIPSYCPFCGRVAKLEEPK